MSELIELEKDARKKSLSGFNQRSFNEALISNGSIAVKHLRNYLLGP